MHLMINGTFSLLSRKLRKLLRQSQLDETVLDDHSYHGLMTNYFVRSGFFGLQLIFLFNCCHADFLGESGISQLHFLISAVIYFLFLYLFLFLFLILYFVLRTIFLFSNNETSSLCFQLFFYDDCLLLQGVLYIVSQSTGNWNLFLNATIVPMSNNNSQNKKNTVSIETKSCWTLLLLTAVKLHYTQCKFMKLCANIFMSIFPNGVI
jgi:hypothetical protein